jgi:phosphoglycolate phosphatase-like HAD superfamily hydrolase
VSSHPAQLVLFDIDGTLLLNGTVVNEIFLEIFERVSGCPPVVGRFSFAGLTDRGIFHRLLEGVTVDEDPDVLYDRFAAEYPTALNEIYATADGPFLLPGVEDLVAMLAARDDVALALATGNIRATAYIKLRRFGLDAYFPVGGFGGDHLERHRVFEAAHAVARAHYALDGEAARPWVIGDTRADVEAARRTGMRVMGVATGPLSVEELADADVALRDLSDTEAVVEALLAPRLDPQSP